MKTDSLFSPTDAPVHRPVLLAETVMALQPHIGGRYLDGTVGAGGHAFAILQTASEKLESERMVSGDDPEFAQKEGNSSSQTYAELCGIDRDSQALDKARIRLEPFASHVHLFHNRYSEFASMLDTLGWQNIDGAILDLGVSSLQLDTSGRGFSFLTNGPLDMRMDNQSHETSAADLVNHADFATLRDLLARYGEDPQAGRIARAIVTARRQKPLTTTAELADIVLHAYPVAWRHNARRHPATRTFQALRIAVNDEIGELEKFLHSILAYLVPNARLAVISFHSVEDRIVKNVMRDWTKACICPPHVPVCVCHHKPEAVILTPKPIIASAAEQQRNPRSRSAKLRVAAKLPENCTAEENSFDRYKRKKARQQAENL